MKRYLFVLLGFCMALSVLNASAQSTSAVGTKKETKKSAKKISKKSKAAEKQEHASIDEDDAVPDIAGSKSIHFHCELGNKLTIYENVHDDKHIALRWNKRLSRLTRVDTTTGAKRFENRSQGLVWIGIPAKSMLLDAKKGRQLANECKSHEQQNSQQTNVQTLHDNASESMQGHAMTPSPSTPEMARK